MAKYSSGKWFINFVGLIPIGINTVIEKTNEGTYSKTLVETLLPDNDDEWDIEKKETMANLKLMEQSKNMFECLSELIAVLEEPGITDYKNELKRSRKLINKISKHI